MLNRIKQKMLSGQVASSMAIRLVRTPEIAHIAHSAGFDGLYIDMEHNTFTIGEAAQICAAALACDITPFVRVPAGAHDLAARLLDGGALGIIAPHLETADDVQRIVNISKFPPFGTRGAVNNLPHFSYRNVKASEANPQLNEETMVIGMIETLSALDNIDEILAVDGLDMVLIGTNDLTAEKGIPGQYDHPFVRDAYRSVIASANKHGKFVGVGGLASRADLVADFVKLGARYVSTGTDLSFLLSASTAKAAFVAGLDIPHQ